MTTNSFHFRIDDHPLSLGMVRYSTGDKEEDKFLWKLVISDFCGSKVHTMIEPTIANLVEMQRFCQQAIETLKTDGGRLK